MIYILFLSLEPARQRSDLGETLLIIKVLEPIIFATQNRIEAQRADFSGLPGQKGIEAMTLYF
jgi:hypothetical protein